MTGGDSRPPYGWVEFCRHHPSECQTNVSEASIVEMTPQVWQILNAVNRSVNGEIRPVTDIDQWGVVEKWGFPDTGRGDCEDYALLKRRQLVERGIPRRAMLMTVVIDETGGGHAILMVRTDRGDMILDNKRASITPWSETGYRYVKRESQAGNGWVGMSDPGASAVATAAR